MHLLFDWRPGAALDVLDAERRDFRRGRGRRGACSVPTPGWAAGVLVPATAAGAHPRVRADAWRRRARRYALVGAGPAHRTLARTLGARYSAPVLTWRARALSELRKSAHVGALRRALLRGARGGGLRRARSGDVRSRNRDAGGGHAGRPRRQTAPRWRWASARAVSRCHLRQRGVRVQRNRRFGGDGRAAARQTGQRQRSMSRSVTSRPPASTEQFALVYLIFNTIFNLKTQDEQVACFENAAAHLDQRRSLRHRARRA